jgi:hypothetical protein
MLDNDDDRENTTTTTKVNFQQKCDVRTTSFSIR